MSRSPIPPPTAPLTDGVVIVRLRRAGDLPHIAGAGEDREAARWLDEPEGRPATPSTPEQIAEIWHSGAAAPLIISDAATDEPAGLINVQFRDGADPSVAYRVFPAWRGRGFAARALDVVCAWAFAELGVQRLVLEIDERNEASIRVAQRSGFTRCGVTTGDEPPKVVFARDRLEV